MELSERRVVETSSVDWVHEPSSPIEVKPLDAVTQLVRVAAGERLSIEDHRGAEVFVLDGDVSDGERTFSEGTYVRLPAGVIASLRSERGCVLFLKRQPFEPNDVEQLEVHTHENAWLPGQGRLEVMPLHEHAGRSTALVKWPAGERFVPHQHWGGEEIFVLSGTFMDEHGSYPAGTWLRSPHLSKHHPFVEDETVILVKVGHLG